MPQSFFISPVIAGRLCYNYGTNVLPLGEL